MFQPPTPTPTPTTPNPATPNPQPPGLLDLAEPKRLWRTEALDDLVALIVTFLSTLTIGVETGVGVGVGVSLFTLVARSANTNYVVLGWVPGTTAFHDIKVSRSPQP
jgi:SulP family sulfate permease